MIISSDKYKGCNHHHELHGDQTIVDFGSGDFVIDIKRIPLLKALNECGLITRTHCYGHETEYSFLSILLSDDVEATIREVTEPNSSREFPAGKKEVLLYWKRTD